MGETEDIEFEGAERKQTFGKRYMTAMRDKVALLTD